jgi:uncharacterized membrane protein YfcA
MARSHHRKKHKDHLRQFQRANSVTETAKGRVKATTLFTIVGAGVGFAITYFGSQNNIWVIAGLVAGGAVGFMLGQRVDRDKVSNKP